MTQYGLAPTVAIAKNHTLFSLHQRQCHVMANKVIAQYAICDNRTAIDIRYNALNPH